MAESATHYTLTNPIGNWSAGTWNLLPAVLTTWSNLLALKGNKTQYELYKEQANQYVQNARENADLIRKRGEIELRNLTYKNKIEQGNDVVRIAAGNGKLSGSNLDVLVRKEKIRKMNEQTLNANYANQAMMEMVNGYKQAASVYGTMGARAGSDKWAALASIFKGVETYVGLQVRDAKIQSSVKAGHQDVINQELVTKENMDANYKGNTSKTATSTFNLETETPDSLSLNNYFVDPADLTVIGNSEANVNNFNYDSLSFKI